MSYTAHVAHSLGCVCVCLCAHVHPSGLVVRKGKVESSQLCPLPSETSRLTDFLKSSFFLGLKCQSLVLGGTVVNIIPKWLSIYSLSLT